MQPVRTRNQSWRLCFSCLFTRRQDLGTPLVPLYPRRSHIAPIFGKLKALRSCTTKLSVIIVFVNTLVNQILIFILLFTVNLWFNFRPYLKPLHYILKSRKYCKYCCKYIKAIKCYIKLFKYCLR